jgi:hypothetical protein
MVPSEKIEGINGIVSKRMREGLRHLFIVPVTRMGMDGEWWLL